MFTKKTSRIGNEARWGVKLLVHFRKVGDKQVARGIYRGKEISVSGKDNEEVLAKLFEVLNKNI